MGTRRLLSPSSRSSWTSPSRLHPTRPEVDIALEARSEIAAGVTNEARTSGSEPGSERGALAATERRALSPSERGKMGGRRRKDKPRRVKREFYITEAQDKQLLSLVAEANRSISSYLRARALGKGAADEAKLKDLIARLIESEASSETFFEALAHQSSQGAIPAKMIEEGARLAEEGYGAALSLAINILKGVALESDDDDDEQP